MNSTVVPRLDLPGRSLAAPARSRPGLGSALARMPLQRRFALVGGIVTLAGMVLTGLWVSGEIQDSVTRNSAISTALYMESFIAPLSQELAHGDALSPDAEARLRGHLSAPPVSERIVAAKIWSRDGLVVFSTDPALTGQRFEVSDSLRRAWAGELTAAFDDLSDEEAAGERARRIPLLEVYNPIHSIVTGEIIAVAEFYQNAVELEADLLDARLASWAVVASTALVTFAALFGVVRNGARIIDRQNRQLTDRLADLARVSAQNDALRRRVEAASRRASETNERLLRRVGAELHDGPAQALALALLRLDSVARRAGAGPGDGEAGELRRSLEEALHDIRDVCRGLTLPELEGRPLAEVLEQAVAAHERRTGSTVERRFDLCPAASRAAPHSTLICVYRFAQEGLMNAFRHAGGRGQSVHGRLAEGRLEITVADAGPGFDPAATRPGLGLSGLRERVESAGGEFALDTGPGAGVRLTMTLPFGVTP